MAGLDRLRRVSKEGPRIPKVGASWFETALK